MVCACNVLSGCAMYVRLLPRKLRPANPSSNTRVCSLVVAPAPLGRNRVVERRLASVVSPRLTGSVSRRLAVTKDLELMCALCLDYTYLRLQGEDP